MMENGQLDFYSRRVSNSQCQSQREKGNSLGLPKVATLFFIFIFGIILSSLVFMYEVCSNFRTSNKKKMFNTQDSVIIEFKGLNQMNPKMVRYLKEKPEEFLYTVSNMFSELEKSV